MRDLLCQGAEARVYDGTWLDRKVIIKHRFSKKYRHPSIDTFLSRDRLKSEARALIRCRMAGVRAPCVYHVDLDAGDLVMERIPSSVTVRTVMQQYCSAVSNEETDSVRTRLEDLAVRIGTVLARLHGANIIHGDLTTSNMLLLEPYDQSEVVLIDFGMSYMDEKVEDKAVDLYVLERAVLGTHVGTEKFVERLLQEYEMCSGKVGKAVIKKLDEVRLRGRKKLCFG